MTAFYKQSWFAPVASAATTFLFPSLGSAVGGAANSLLGGALSEGAANALGSSLIGGGIGALSNGAQGALTGGLAGGLTSGLMSATGLTGGLSGLLSNGTFSGAGTGAAGGFNGSGADVTRGLADRQATDAAAAAAGKTADSGVLSKAAGLGGIGTPGMIAGMALLGGLGSAMSGGQKQQQAAAPITSTDPNMTRGLSQVAFNRTQRPYEGDPKTYGMRPQHNYFDNNAIPAADGGYMGDKVRGRSFPQQWWDDSYTGAALKALGVGPRRRDPLADVEMIYRGPPGRPMGDTTPSEPIDYDKLHREMQGSARGYADGGAVMPMGGMPPPRPMGPPPGMGPQGAMQMPPQAMMGQGPGMGPMGQPPGGMGRPPMGGMPGMGRPGGMPSMPMQMGHGRPMGGGMGRGGPMGDRDGALAMMAQQNGRAAFADGGAAMRSESVQAERGRRQMRSNPRPSMMHHWMNPGQASVDEAMWKRGALDYQQAGGRYTDGYARGGVSGPGTGRSDHIPAVLSDGEYVIDATTVALLGDGSSKAGAEKLDQMREEVRRRAGAHLAKGKMGPDAKPALSYIPGAR